MFEETPANPTEAAVRDALALYRSEGCDGIVAIGADRQSISARP